MINNSKFDEKKRIDLPISDVSSLRNSPQKTKRINNRPGLLFEAVFNGPQKMGH